MYNYRKLSKSFQVLIIEIYFLVRMKNDTNTLENHLAVLKNKIKCTLTI